VQFPEQWVTSKKNLTITYNIYPEEYLPMATTWQNTSNSIFYAYTSTLSVISKTDIFRTPVTGLWLPPGRYYVSCVVAAHDARTYYSQREYMVSLGLFRVEGKLPSAVKTYLPHYSSWWRTSDPQVKLDDAKATVKGKTISLSGAYTRVKFQKGQKPVYLEATAEQGTTKRVILRLRQPLTQEKTKFGGKAFTIGDHELAAGTYTLRITAYTEHPSSYSAAYLTGSKSEKTVNISIP
jgi:hypothetical protein